MSKSIYIQYITNSKKVYFYLFLVSYNNHLYINIYNYYSLLLFIIYWEDSVWTVVDYGCDVLCVMCVAAGRNNLLKIYFINS